jgi:S1-C subfamily serine protease
VDKEKRLVLTNSHVVGDKTAATVFFPAAENGQTITDPSHYLKNRTRLGIQGRVVARRQRQDLALIQLPSLPEGVQAVPLAARSVRPGQMMYALGNSGFEPDRPADASGALWRYSDGKARLVYRKKFLCAGLGGALFEVDAEVVETQVPINSGDSGGPMVNDKGELVALTQSQHNKERLVTYGIDVREVRDFLSRWEKEKEELARKDKAKDRRAFAQIDQSDRDARKKGAPQEWSDAEVSRSR